LLDSPVSVLVARIHQVIGVGVVVVVIAGWLPIPKTLHDLPQQVRWLAALVGLAMGLGLLWLERRRDVAGGWANLPLWKRVAALSVVAGVLFLVRPRLHWGDSVALVSALDAGVHRWNPRWLTGMVGLAYAFDPLRPVMSGTLFLTLAYIGLGCVEVALLMATLKVVSEGRKIPCAAVLLVLASPATLFLMSGYLEIYPMAQFGIVTFLWAAAAFAVRRRWMGFPLFGLVCGLTGMLYVGNLILLPLGAVLMGIRLIAEPAPYWKTQLRQGLGFGAGALLGLYSSFCLVIGESWPGVRRIGAAGASVLSDSALVLRHEATSVAWYAPLLDALTASRAREYCETWSLYGFFGLMFVVMVASAVLVDPVSCGRALRSFRNGFFVMLASLVAAQLIASLLKTQPMGFRDWDLFTYAAYPVNLLAACLLVRLQNVPSLAAVGRTFAVCASVWCLLVYAYMNPVRPEWSGLPRGKRDSAFESYHLMSRISASEAEARGIREVSPFP
jgi:hypothetical protein